MKEESTTDSFKNATGWSIALAVLMIVVGFFAIMRPAAAGIGVSVFVGWLIIFSGIVYVGYAFTAQGFGSFAWRALIGALYMFGGFYLIANPGLALESLTFVVAVIILAEGVLQMIGYFQVRSAPGSGWILFDGLVTFGLGILIIYPWPSSSSWAIGTLVGVNLILSGFTRLMYSITARKVVNAVAS